MSAVTVHPAASATIRHALNLALVRGRYLEVEVKHIEGLADDLLLAELGKAPVTTPEPVTIAYIAIGAAQALHDGESDLVDRLVEAREGQLNVIEEVCAHALMLDQMAAAQTDGLDGVFAYEIAEEFGHRYVCSLLIEAAPSATDIARGLFAEMRDRATDLPF